MEAAIPAIKRQAGFRGRIFPGGLDGGQVFRKNDAAFEFIPARIFALRQVNRAAGAPELVPVGLGVSLDAVESRTTGFSA